MRIRKFLTTLIAILALASVATETVGMTNNQVVEARVRHKKSRKHSLIYYARWHRVRVTRTTQVYRVIRGKYGYQNKYRKAYKLRPGKRVNIQYRGIEWMWTIGHSYKYCAMRNSTNWFRVIR